MIKQKIRAAANNAAALQVRQLTKKTKKPWKINAFGGNIEWPELFNNSFSSQYFDSKANSETKHRRSSIDLFTENLLGIRGGVSGWGHMVKETPRILTKVTKGWRSALQSQFALLIQTFLETVRQASFRWAHFSWFNPSETKSSPKSRWVVRNGANFLIG